jgi:alpha-L-rhamnosidase
MQDHSPSDRGVLIAYFRMTLFVPAIAVGCFAGCHVLTPSSRADAHRSVITDHGAIGDGTNLNTEAIQKTIDQVAASGGGTVIIPEGVFLSGAIFLKAGVSLHLDRNAVLKGSTNVSDYPRMMTRIEGHFQPWLPALVNADKVDHLRITGEGTLDGSGKPFWDEFRRRVRADRTTKNLDVERPRLVFIENSQDVQISGIHLKDSGFWNLHLYRCREVVLDGLDIQAVPGSPSTDGTDIDSSQNVTIRGCHYAVNDDCIALKGSKGLLALEDKDSPPVEHIHVSDCTFERGGSFVTCGSEATIVRDVVVERCKASGSENRGMSMVRLKLRVDTPQTYEEIHFRDITLAGAGNLISVQPWRQYSELKEGQKPPKHLVRNVTLSNIKGSFGTFGGIRGNPDDRIEQVTFENIDVQLSAATPLPQLSGITNLVIKAVKINGADYTGP